MIVAAVLVFALIAMVSFGFSAKLNAGSLASSAWLVVVVTATFPGLMRPGLSEETSLLLVCTGLAFAGFPIGWAISKALRGTRELPRYRFAVQRKLLLKVHLSLLLLLFFNGLIDLVRLTPLINSMGGFLTLWEGSGAAADFRLSVLADRQEAILAGDGSVFGILGYLTAVGLASFTTGAVFWLEKRYFLALAPLAIMALNGFVVFERTGFIMGLLILILSLSVLKAAPPFLVGPPSAQSQRKSFIPSIPRPVVYATILMGAAAVLLLPLLARNSGTGRSVGFVSLGQYMLSSLAGLNQGVVDGSAFDAEFLKNGAGRASSPGFGAYTFFGIFDLLGRAGLTLPRGVVTAKYTEVSLFGLPFTTNTKTMIWNLYLDFGAWGAFIALFILCVICGSLGFRVTRGELRLVGMYSLLAGAIVWSFFGNVMLSNFKYAFSAFVVYVIFVRLGSKEESTGVFSKGSSSTIIGGSSGEARS